MSKTWGSKSVAKVIKESKGISEFDLALKLLVLAVKRECRSAMQDYNLLGAQHYALDRKHYYRKVQRLYNSK